MIKFSIKAIIFFIILFFIVLLSGKLFLNKQNVQSFRSEEYKTLKGNIDVGFFGSSHAFSSFDPRIIENELQVSAYNYGVAAQNLITTKAIIENKIKKRNLKLGVVDIFWETLREPPFSNRISNFQLQSIDYMDFSINKIELFTRIFGRDSILNIFPTIRDHAMWSERIFQRDYHLKNDIDYYKGFKPPVYFNKKVWDNLVNEEEENNKPYKVDSKYQLTSGQKQIIDDIIELFRNENVPLLFVSAPIHKKYIDNKYYNYQKRIEEYLKEKNVSYVDYNELSEELELHLFDYKDESHLNTNGALKVSQHLSAYIKKHYKLRKTISNSLKNNRYSILNKPNSESVIQYSKIENLNVKKQTGVEDVIVYKDNYGRLEVLLVGEELLDISVKVEYEVQTFTELRTAREVSKNIKKGKYMLKEFLPNRKKEGLYNGYNYQESEFKVLIVDCPFKEINNLKLSLGSKNPKTSILEIENLKFE